MSKISRADSKARFRTGMYPTQADFENLHDSYVHKDDTIPLEQVGTNGATVVSLLNQKANSSHSHEIKDVDGLEAFINKVNTFLDTVDASDDTINRWKEVEAFLTGITDTQTLTGLLANLRTEIVALIPEADTKAYLQLVADLDAYTDAPVGTIVKYTGQTNNKYTHGFDYERKAGDGQPVEFMVPAGTPTINRIFVPESAPDNYKQFISNAKFPFKREGSYSEFTTFRASNGSVEVLFLFSNHPSVGDLVFLREDFAPHFITEADDASFKTDIDDYSWSLSSIEPNPATAYVNVDGLRIVLDEDFERFNTPSTETDINSPVIIPDQRLYFWGDRYNHVFMEKKSADQTYSYPGGSPSSWQPCKSMSVID